MNKINTDVLALVIEFCGDSLHGLLRQVCSHWCACTRTNLFAYAHITTEELLRWAEAQPGYNEMLCMEIMAFKQRDDLMPLFQNSVYIREGYEPAILNAMVMRRRVVHLAENACTALPLQWGWTLWPDQKLLESRGYHLKWRIKELQRLNNTISGAKHRNWSDLASRGILYTGEERFRTVWCSAVQVTPIVLVFICTDFYKSLSCGLPLERTELHVHIHRKCLMEWLSENVLLLHDSRVLSVINTHETTWMIAALVTALQSKEEYTVNPTDWKFAAGVGLAIAIVNAHTGLVATFHQICCAQKTEVRLDPALRHVIIENKISRVLNASTTLNLDSHAQLRALIFFYTALAGCNASNIKDVMARVETGPLPFVSSVLLNDGESRKWMLKNGPLLPVKLARIVLCNKHLHRRALDVGFEFPDLTIQKATCNL